MRTLATCLLLMLGVGSQAQEAQRVLVIDQERLFNESVFGRRSSQEIEQRSLELASENRQIEAELIAEEQELTERRQDLSPEEFRALAEAFDEKVQQLRAQQDAKSRDLAEMRDQDRQEFASEVEPIIVEFLEAYGASVILDRRSVLAVSNAADVTDDLIARIDAQSGAQ